MELNKGDKMNIPKEIKIGGLIYNVLEEKNLLRDSSCSGRSCGNLQDIRIEEGISRQFKETTFIHEVLHQIDFVYNIGLEHQQIFQLEAGIYAFIKDNPDIFKGETCIDKSISLKESDGIVIRNDTSVEDIAEILADKITKKAILGV
jgi:hypothetical protein